jgi:hypothetical protein
VLYGSVDIVLRNLWTTCGKRFELVDWMCAECGFEPFAHGSLREVDPGVFRCRARNQCANRVKRGASPKNALIDRAMWHPVKADGECLIWQGRTTSQGYGRVTTGVRYIAAHRLIFEVLYGPLAKGEIVRHTCDRPACVRPKHLLRGTQADNMRDMAERGRGRKKEVRE